MFWLYESWKGQIFFSKQVRQQPQNALHYTPIAVKNAALRKLKHAAVNRWTPESDRYIKGKGRSLRNRCNLSLPKGREHFLCRRLLPTYPINAPMWPFFPKRQNRSIPEQSYLPMSTSIVPSLPQLLICSKLHTRIHLKVISIWSSSTEDKPVPQLCSF